MTVAVGQRGRASVTAGGELSFRTIAGLATAAVITAVVFVSVGMFRSAPREARSAELKQDAPIGPVKKSAEIVEENRPAVVVQLEPPAVFEKSRPPIRKAVAPKTKTPVRKRAKPVVTRTQESTATIDRPALKPFNANATWPVPKLNDANYRKWITFVRPSGKDLKWRKIRWHKSLSVAAVEAKKLKRPILLWTMNGHPCGET